MEIVGNEVDEARIPRALALGSVKASYDIGGDYLKLVVKPELSEVIENSLKYSFLALVPEFMGYKGLSIVFLDRLVFKERKG